MTPKICTLSLYLTAGKSRGEFVHIFGAVSLYQVILKSNGLYCFRFFRSVSIELLMAIF